MKHTLAPLIPVLFLAALALGQAAEPPQTDNPPQTQPADSPVPMFRLGGAPPKDDGRPKPPPPPKEEPKPAEPAPEKPAPEKPADPPKPVDAPKPEAPKPQDAPATQPMTQPATQPATRPEPVGPFKLGNNNVNLPKPDPDKPLTDKPAATKPTSKPAQTADGADPDDPLKEPTFSQPDFPPGLFSDGNFYRLADLQGKAIVLFFFDSSDERVLATIPHRNALIKKFRDKPVVFFGVENDTINNVQRAVRFLNLQMPVFADTLGVMMSRYRVRITASSTWNVCIIDGAGKASHEEMTEAAIERALQSAHWRYRDKLTPDPRINPALDALEMGDLERGMRLLQPWITHADKRASESARSLLAILRAEAEPLKPAADKLGPTQSVLAFDTYSRIMQMCPGADLAKAAAVPLKKLSSHREVRSEVAARNMYKVLCNAISRDEGIEKWDALGYCEEIIRSAPGTPTADKLVKYLDDLGKVRERGVLGPRQYRRANTTNNMPRSN